MKKLVIAGNGGAAISAVRAVRSINSDDEITIISKESSPAYSPALTIYYLGGSIGYRNMFICDASFYREKRVNTLLGRKIAKVDTLLRKVYADRGEVLSYDDLLIATGSSSFVPSIKGVDTPGVFNLYTARDARKIINFIETKKSVAVIGAGPIGIHAVGALANRGKKVFLVEMADQILPEIFDARGAGILEEKLQEKAVGTYLGETVLGIYERRRKKVIALASGAEIIADAVILSVGVSPNVGFLGGSGIKLNRGVIIDQHCRASTDGVYAAGDAAEAPDALVSNYTINATWPNAIEQGRVAGLNMVGQRSSILRNLRFNAVSIFGLSCISLGLIRQEGKKLEEVFSQDEAGYRKMFFKDGFLVGAVLLGETEDAGIIASLIEKRALLPDLYEAVLRHRVFTHSLKEYYWSIFLGVKGR